MTISRSRSISDQNIFRSMIIAAGPRFRPGDRLKTWLATVAQRAGLHPRIVLRAWHGLPVSKNSVTRLQEAARHGIRDEATDLAFQLEILAQRLRAQDEPGYQPHAATLDETARILRGLALGVVGNE